MFILDNVLLEIYLFLFFAYDAIALENIEVSSG